MRYALAALLIFPVPGHCLTLACELFTPALYARNSTLPVTINVEPQTGNVRFYTTTEGVGGTVGVSEADFRGWVTGANTGKRYWFSLDRYSGQMVLTREAYAHGDKAEMWGECRAAKQRF